MNANKSFKDYSHRAKVEENEERFFEVCRLFFDLLCMYFYRPQTKFAKVMFLQVSVCPHVGACMVAPGGACMVALGGHAWFLWGGCSGGHAWLLGGVCMVALVRGMRGCCGGAHVWLLLGGGAMHAWDMMRYGDTINEWMVRILLECILVKIVFTFAPTLAWCEWAFKHFCSHFSLV